MYLTREELSEQIQYEEQAYYAAVNKRAKELAAKDGQTMVEVPNMDTLTRIAELVPHFKIDGLIESGQINSRKNTIFYISKNNQ